MSRVKNQSQKRRKHIETSTVDPTSAEADKVGIGESVGLGE